MVSQKNSNKNAQKLKSAKFLIGKCQTKNILSVALLKLKYFKDINKHCEIETC